MTLVVGDRFEIPRQWIDSCGGSKEIASLVRELPIRRRPISMTISGYDFDDRDLFEIPEVCKYARWLHAEYPDLYFHLDDFSKACFVCWLLGPFPQKDLDSPKFKSKMKKKMAACERESSR